LIYVASILDETFVKLGFTQGNPPRRIADLQVGCPFQINLDFVVEGTRYQEEKTHNQLSYVFEHLSIPCSPNEWYPTKHPFIQRFLTELRSDVSAAKDYAVDYVQQQNIVRQPIIQSWPTRTEVLWYLTAGTEIIASTEIQTAEILKQAETCAEEIVEQAKAQAVEILKQAEVQAAKIIIKHLSSSTTNATPVKQQIELQAEARAEEIINRAVTVEEHADTQAAEMIEQADAQAAAIIEQAKIRAGKIETRATIEYAEAQAKKIIAEAQAKAEHAQVNAEQAVRIVKQAEVKAAKIEARAEKRAEAEAAKIVGRAEVKAAKIEARAVKRAEVEAATIMGRAEVEVVKAEAKAAKIVERAEARVAKLAALDERYLYLVATNDLAEQARLCEGDVSDK
jgi:vacuolar-type H+-ATPase subunit H